MIGKNVLLRGICLVLILCFMFFISGCCDNDDDDGEEITAKTGRFVDVEGLNFTSGGYAGITNAQGGFRYEEKKTIIFKVGDIVIGRESLSKPVMTPIDLVENAINHRDYVVTNISRFLQTLDEDQVPENGIFISEKVRNAARGKILDFYQDQAAFESAAQNLLDSLFDKRRALVSVQNAQKHLQNTIIALVKTNRDDKGVWFISGEESLYSTFEAMGYAVATDRLWQAEVFRRTARGRLAEIFGENFLKSDMLMRITGYSEDELQAGFDNLAPEAKTIVSAYVEGFNRRIAEVRNDRSLIPYEFLTLDITIEDWTVKDVLAWMSVLLRMFDPEAMEMEGTPAQVKNANLYLYLAERFPDTYQGMFNDLRWINDPDALTYIPKKTRASRSQQDNWIHPSNIPKDILKIDEMLISRKDISENLKKINAFVKMGSYAWVVAGNKTASGNPILYSGPQMGFSVPSIVLEGSIQAGGLNISGMTIPGIPGIIIGRTPHHAWSMQVGHAHTVDYYIEPSSAAALHRIETIRVSGRSEDFELPVYRTPHGPVINPIPFDPSTYVSTPENPVLSWKYSHWGYEFDTIKAFFDIAKANNIDDFGNAVERIGVSQHFCYVDKDKNIAYWMSGREPVRPDGEYRFPQGFASSYHLEWSADKLMPRSHDRNTSQGYYCGWNNKSASGYNSAYNTKGYYFGVFHRAHVIDDYLSSNNRLSFEDVRDLALLIATTDSFNSGGNPWKFVSNTFSQAIKNAGLNTERQFVLDLLKNWDGHFVAGGKSQWVRGTDRSDAWMLMDSWIREALRLTFLDELGTANYEEQDFTILFNVMLHGLAGNSSGVINNYDWFSNRLDSTAPQTADAIIVKSLDNTLLALGSNLPWGAGKRGDILYHHDLFNNTVLDPIHETPFSRRSTYAQCVEYDVSGPVLLESMFPLGESGMIFRGTGGSVDFDDHFFSMTEEFDNFNMRSFPLF